MERRSRCQSVTIHRRYAVVDAATILTHPVVHPVPRPLLLHSTNSHYTSDLLSSPYYSSSRDKDTMKHFIGLLCRGIILRIIAGGKHDKGANMMHKPSRLELCARAQNPEARTRCKLITNPNAVKLCALTHLDKSCTKEQSSKATCQALRQQHTAPLKLAFSHFDLLSLSLCPDHLISCSFLCQDQCHIGKQERKRNSVSRPLQSVSAALHEDRKGKKGAERDPNGS